MKKFSNISNVKVSEEPKLEVKQLNEEEIFKVKVMNLMEQLLSIRTYGPIDRYLRAGNIKIAGKEMFLEALMDALKGKSLKEETKKIKVLKKEAYNSNDIEEKTRIYNLLIEMNGFDSEKEKDDYKRNLQKFKDSLKAEKQSQQILLLFI